MAVWYLEKVISQRFPEEAQRFAEHLFVWLVLGCFAEALEGGRSNAYPFSFPF
jgi:hypothetical protein